MSSPHAEAEDLGVSDVISELSALSLSSYLATFISNFFSPDMILSLFLLQPSPSPDLLSSFMQYFQTLLASSWGQSFSLSHICCQAHQVCHSRLPEYRVTGCACLWNATTWPHPRSFSCENFLADPDSQDFSFFACLLSHLFHCTPPFYLREA